MNCPHCGFPLTEPSSFCPRCGNPVPVSVLQAPYPQQPYVQNGYIQPPARVLDKKTLKKIQKQRMKEDKARRPRKKHGCLITFLIFLLLPIGLLVWLGTRIFQPNSSAASNPADTNSALLPETELVVERSTPLRDSLPRGLSIDRESIQYLDEGKTYGVVDHIVTVIFQPGVSDAEVESAAAFVHGTVASCYSGMDLFTIRVPESGMDALQEVCSRLMTLSCVRRAFPDSVASVSESFVDYALDDVVPNDPWRDTFETRTESWSMLFPGGRNWSLERVGVPSTWAYRNFCQREADGRPIRVGIADSGFATRHGDVSIRITNMSDNNPGAHGTHVAGILGAVRGNGVGITGTAIESTLLGASLPTAGGTMNQVDTNRIITVLGELLQNNCRIVNMSFGMNHTSAPANPANEMANYSRDGANILVSLADRFGPNFLLVQAAGNNAMDASLSGILTYITQQDLENALHQSNTQNLTVQQLRDMVIVVANSTSKDKLSARSSYGTQVDLAAPGSDIYSTSYVNGQNTYEKKSGTSMAAPLVAGVAASVWSMDLSMTPGQVKQIILTTATEEVETNDAEGGSRTYPLLNAKAAVEKVLLDSHRITEGRPDGDWKALLKKFVEADLERKRTENTQKMETMQADMINRLNRGDYAGYLWVGFRIWLLMFKDLWYQILALIYMLVF